MSVKDSLGNTIKKGDLVRLNLSGNQIICRVGEVSEGGTLIPVGKNRAVKNPGMITVLPLPQPIFFDPDSGSANELMVVKDPEEEEETKLLQ